MKKIIDQQVLGQVKEFESHFDRFRNSIKANAWREEDIPGSGMLYDLGAHLIDQAVHLFGAPSTIYADLRTMRTGGKTVDAFDVHLGYEHVKVTLKSSMLVRELGPRMVLHGTNGSFVKYGLDPQEDALKSGKKPPTKDGATKSIQYTTLTQEKVQ